MLVFSVRCFLFQKCECVNIVQEKVGKEEDVLVETWIGNALAFVTVGRNVMARS